MLDLPIDSTVLSLVVGSVVEEEGWGGGRLYFESKHLRNYNVEYVKCYMIRSLQYAHRVKNRLSSFISAFISSFLHRALTN